MQINKIKIIFHSAVLMLCLSLLPNIAAAELNKDFCIYGKTGLAFSVSAEWFDANGSPVASGYYGDWDAIPVWQWACAPSGAASVRLSVVGASIGNAAIKAVLLGATTVGGAVACVGSAGAGCIAAAGAATAAVDMISQIPDAEAQFLKMAIPNSPTYIEVWGSMWDPQVMINEYACTGC